MPNRIIKESICTSDSIDALSWFEEAFFYRLIVNCDDFGYMDARPKILKSKLFPLRDEISTVDIENALAHLHDVGCIQLYTVENKPFLYLPTWADHQRIRNKKAKYPDPEMGEIVDDLDSYGSNTQTLDRELLTNDGPPARVYENPIQSESNPESESKYCAEQNSAPETGEAPDAVMTLPLNDKTEFPILESDVEKWAELYPAVDILSELRKMRGWLDANQKRRKTKSGILRFVNGWLSREQDRGVTRGTGPGEGISFLDV